jgi:hypothetical protein
MTKPSLLSARIRRQITRIFCRASLFSPDFGIPPKPALSHCHSLVSARARPRRWTKSQNRRQSVIHRTAARYARAPIGLIRLQIFQSPDGSSKKITFFCSLRALGMT